MPKKQKKSPYLHPNTSARLIAWGRCIRTQRVLQHITADAFCSRIDVSASTLRRIELGDSAVSVGSYLTALNALGLLQFIVPMPEAHWMNGDPKSRAKANRDDDDYF